MSLLHPRQSRTPTPWECSHDCFFSPAEGRRRARDVGGAPADRTGPDHLDHALPTPRVHHRPAGRDVLRQHEHRPAPLDHALPTPAPRPLPTATRASRTTTCSTSWARWWSRPNAARISTRRSGGPTRRSPAERLPAEALDAEILDALLCTYERTDLFDKAVVEAGITKAEDAIERYLSAFESGTLSEAQCAKRLEGLAAKVRNLRQRREELVVAVQQASATAPDAEVIDEMRQHIEKAVTGGTVPARKAILRALVHEIRVEGRDRVISWFRVPGGANSTVRALARSAGRPRQDSNLRPSA